MHENPMITYWFFTTRAELFIYLSAMITNNIQIDKFDGENFPLWKFTIQTILSHKGLLKIVNGLDVKPESNKEIELENREKKETEATMILVTGLDASQRSLVMTCTLSASTFL